MNIPIVESHLFDCCRCICCRSCHRRFCRCVSTNGKKKNEVRLMFDKTVQYSKKITSIYHIQKMSQDITNCKITVEDRKRTRGNRRQKKPVAEMGLVKNDPQWPLSRHWPQIVLKKLNSFFCSKIQLYYRAYFL
jgi:hypothetical protein